MHIDVDHGCGRTHHGWPSVAGCRWPEAAFVTGDGAHAVVAGCDMVSVALYESPEEARRRLWRLDTAGCGRGCAGTHELVHLAQVEAPTAR